MSHHASQNFAACTVAGQFAYSHLRFRIYGFGFRFKGLHVFMAGYEPQSKRDFPKL